MKSKDQNTTTSIALFQEKTVRRIWHNEQWYFSVIDVIAILTDSDNPRRYWSDLKRKLKAEGYNELYEKIVQLRMASVDGKKYATDTAATLTLLRDLSKKQKQIETSQADSGTEPGVED